MEIPRPSIESEMQLQAYVTATATQDLSHICDLHCSLQQRWIFNPLSKARIEPTEGRNQVLNPLRLSGNFSLPYLPHVARIPPEMLFIA